MSEERCIKCGVVLLNAPGIGPYCPNLACERIDDQRPEGQRMPVIKACVCAPGPESILQEAQRITHGPRQADYGHPLDDYGRTAQLASVLLSHKLKEPLTAHEMALLMCCVKLSREMNAPKRDNMTDLAGYAWVAQECLDETIRRNKEIV